MSSILLSSSPIVQPAPEAPRKLEASPWADIVFRNVTRLAALLDATAGLKRVTVTTHRRESFGEPMAANLRALRGFVQRHPDTAVIFPMHPNPAVRAAAGMLGGLDRVWLTDPLDYPDFIGLLAESWVIASDSGGVQEEAPSLGKPVLVMRDTTERPEAVDAGTVKLVGTDQVKIVSEAYRLLDDTAAYEAMSRAHNPYGDGHAARYIVDAIEKWQQQRSRKSA